MIQYEALTSLNSSRTWRVTWMWSFLMCFRATTEFQQDLTSDLNVVLLDVLQSYDCIPAGLDEWPEYGPSWCASELRLYSSRTWRVTWMWSFLMCFRATTEFQQDLTSDLNVVLLDVFQSYDNSLMESDVREDLSGPSSNAGHWSTVRWLGRVVEHGVGSVLGVLRLIHAALWSACAASQRRLHTTLLSYQYWQLLFTYPNVCCLVDWLITD